MLAFLLHLKNLYGILRTVKTTEAGLIMKDSDFKVFQHVRASFTEYEIVGPKDLVEEKVQEIYRAYPSVAYGTWQSGSETLGEGNVLVRMKRSNSAD
jgi:hypothetical protein